MERAEGIKTPLRLYNTLSRKVENLECGQDSTVKIYCCGPTVYRDAHIGNLRTFLLADITRRALEFANFKVDLVQNITDVGHMSEDFEEDKILAQSKSEARDPFEVARDYESKFHSDCRAINIKPARLYPRASETIDLMIDSIKKLLSKNLAYQGEDNSIYFAAEKFPTYGALSGNRLDALKPGHRYEFTEGGAKRFHADWALWKSAGNRSEMIWDTPWGRGFPGWHIECTAMSLKYLDGHVDLHIGGIDLRFPHHENERAQSNSLIEKEAVSLWLHGEHLLFEGRKMSKSAGNVVLVKDLIERRINPLTLRFCFMENRYRSQMDLSWDSLIAAHNLLNRWRSSYQKWLAHPVDKSAAVAKLTAAIAEDFYNDLDTPQAIIKLRAIEKSELSNGEKRALFENLDQLFGLELLHEIADPDLPDIAKALLADRAAAREAKDFAKSDQLRDELAKLGISVKDVKDGQEWSWQTK
jgi:cysteinyl-tRNA synthetase